MSIRRGCSHFSLWPWCWDTQNNLLAGSAVFVLLAVSCPAPSRLALHTPLNSQKRVREVCRYLRCTTECSSPPLLSSGVDVLSLHGYIDLGGVWVFLIKEHFFRYPIKKETKRSVGWTVVISLGCGKLWLQHFPEPLIQPLLGCIQ